MSLSQTEIVSLLRKSEAFATAWEADLRALGERFAAREIAADEWIVRQDDRGEEMFVIVRGACDVIARKGKGGDERVVASLGEGAVFGEIAALTGGKRLASVRATSDGELLVIGHDALQQVLHRSPKLTESICLSLARYMDA